MSAGVLPLGLIRDRVRDQCPLFLEVGDGAGLARIAQVAVVPPACFVIPISDVPGANRYAGDHPVSQMTLAQFALIYAARDLSPHDRGSGALTELEEARSQARAALVGWMPAGAHESCRLARGRLTSGLAGQGVGLWQDDFTTRFDLRSTS
ncbi:MAG: hypothetical protein AAF416_17210 [Pseudomonadota bacterium]